MTNRKHHVKDKQITTLSGWFHSPLRVGERAIISGVNGFSILTSPILTILERGKNQTTGGLSEFTA